MDNAEIESEKSGRLKWAILAGIAGGAVVISLLPVMRRRAMRVTAILKRDHRLVHGLLLTLEKTPKNTSLRNPLVERLYGIIITHERAEDEIVYSNLPDIGLYEIRLEVEQARKAQAAIRDRVTALRQADPLGDEFDRKVGDLKQSMLQHADLEEHSIFQYLEQRLSPDEQLNMGLRLHALKKDLMEEVAA